VHGLGIAHRASHGGYETGRPLEAVGNGAQADRLGAVLALVVADLTRTWAKQKRKRGPTLPNAAVLQPTIKESTWKAVELSQQQSARMAKLPEDYRVVGVERRAPLVRKPTGQVIRIQQDGRLTAATIAGQGQSGPVHP
jgi:hypothetical protein